MKKIVDKLLKNKDEKYKEFTSKIIPNINSDTIIGVRMPIIKDITKEIIKSKEEELFMNELPHQYYEENVIHSKLISNIKDEDKLIYEIERFIPYIDNWAVNDAISPKIIKNHQEKVFEKIKIWLKSKETYRIRLCSTLLLDFYINDKYIDESNKLLLKVNNDDYYVKMAIAWYYSFAIINYYDKTIPILENKLLDRWTHNKTISKCIDSYKIANERKSYLKSLKY